MPLQSLLYAFWKRYRLWLLGGLVCGWLLFVSTAWWLMNEAGRAIKGVQEILHIGALPVT
jgi:hypothetical protein